MTDHTDQHEAWAFDSRELRTLASAQCDGSISDSEAHRLEAMLSASGDAREMYVAFMDLHAGLDWEITSRAAATAGAGPEPGIGRRFAWVLPRSLHSLTALPYLAVCAGLLLAFTYWVFFAADSADSPSTDSQGAVIAQVSDPSAASRWSVFNRTGSQDRIVHGHPLNANDQRNPDSESVRADEFIELESGRLEIRFTSGAVVTLEAPAVLQVLSPMRARAVRGTMTARVAAGAEGFTIVAPRATIVDLGTLFGIDVNPSGRTDVVVFEGRVDLKYGVEGRNTDAWQRRELTMGEAMQVDAQGTAHRIMSVINRQFGSGPASPRTASQANQSQQVIISDVRDNIRSPHSYDYYGIVHRGMGEDAKAFVDREEHEWNGLNASGMPAYLVGGDYVQMFNNDKTTDDIEVSVSLAHAARLYVLFDDRAAPPAWLRDRFRDTGDDIGLDVGKFHWKGRFDNRRSPGVGPGVSIDETTSVWVRDVPSPGTVRLGATEAPDHHINMYGIVAVALEEK